jgi:hypothetical protein
VSLATKSLLDGGRFGIRCGPKTGLDSNLRRE